VGPSLSDVGAERAESNSELFIVQLLQVKNPPCINMRQSLER
jgi:hypothetical protein